MQAWMKICIMLSLGSGLLKLILEAAGGEKAAKVLQAVLGILMLSLTICAFCGDDLPSVSISDFDQHAYYQELQEETMEAVFASAEKELGNKLCETLREKFEKEPLACSVTVDRETLTLTHLQIVYPADSIMISTYQIKNYIYTTYGVEAEVIFE